MAKTPLRFPGHAPPARQGLEVPNAARAQCHGDRPGALAVGHGTLPAVKIQTIPRILIMSSLWAGCADLASDSETSGCSEWVSAQMLNDELVVNGERCIRFSTEQIGEVAFSINGSTSPGIASLVHDKNGNGALDDTSEFHTEYFGEGVAIFTSPIPASTFFLVLKLEGKLSLTAAFTPHPEPETKPDPGSTGREAATLDAPVTIRVGGYIGRLDERDVYRLRVAEPSTLALEMQDDSTLAAPITLKLHLDRNNNQLPEDDELFEHWYNTSQPLSRCVEPGEYFLSVLNGEGLYTLAGGVSPREDSVECVGDF